MWVPLDLMPGTRTICFGLIIHRTGLQAKKGGRAPHYADRTRTIAPTSVANRSRKGHGRRHLSPTNGAREQRSEGVLRRHDTKT